MSTAEAWKLDPGTLQSSLERWRATEPSATERERVHEWLMDFALDPMRRGEEDPNSPGVYFARIIGTNIGVTFVPDPEARVVHVVNIA